jgi:5'-3' exonuclease
MKRLVLIDGNAILHRAYHALPPLTAPDGSVVNAVYGFTSMLFKIFSDLAPSYIAVAFDRPKPTFRKKMFKAYQAKRPKMDDELAGQIEKVHEMIRAFGIPIFEKDGFEADDVIGTLATLASKRQSVKASTPPVDQVIIVTGDKDLLQLVNDRVFLFMPTKGLSEAKLYMDKDVKERLGVDAKHVTDYKGFAGDNSDNYPGVEGIGPKTAVSLIDTFGTVEKLYDALKKKDKRLDNFSDSVIEKLKKGEKSAKLSKDLATIRTDVELDDSGFKTPIATLDTPEGRAVLSELHFHSLLKRLTGEGKRETLRRDPGQASDPTSPRLRGAGKKEKETKTGEQQNLF